MDAHAFNASPPRRIIGYQCTNSHFGKVFTNVFAYNQHRNHATQEGTLCASIMMREELTAVRRADRSSAVLSAQPRRSNERDARTKRDAHRRMSLSLCRHPDMKLPDVERARQLKVNEAKVPSNLFAAAAKRKKKKINQPSGKEDPKVMWNPVIPGYSALVADRDASMAANSRCMARARHPARMLLL